MNRVPLAKLDEVPADLPFLNLGLIIGEDYYLAGDDTVVSFRVDYERGRPDWYRIATGEGPLLLKEGHRAVLVSGALYIAIAENYIILCRADAWRDLFLYTNA